MSEIISNEAIDRRNYWVQHIDKAQGVFAADSKRLESELKEEISSKGVSAILDHLRLCGNIPESYGHDTSEEKQYSKYTDAVLAFAYKSMGLKSLIITERADVADVEAFANEYSFVADAKAFRLSRTAKNQKDFKVQAMDRWKHGKPFAMVVCPIYQLPSKSSQIYEQAITRSVCVFTYSHLSLLVRFAQEESESLAEELLHDIFNIIPAMHPTKSAHDYWLGVNKLMISRKPIISDLWREEKIAAIESIQAAKEEALVYLTAEREKIMRLTHEEALAQLVSASKIDSKITTINKISDNGLLGIK